MILSLLGPYFTKQITAFVSSFFPKLNSMLLLLFIELLKDHSNNKGYKCAKRKAIENPNFQNLTTVTNTVDTRRCRFIGRFCWNSKLLLSFDIHV